MKLPSWVFADGQVDGARHLAEVVWEKGERRGLDIPHAPVNG